MHCRIFSRLLLVATLLSNGFLTSSLHDHSFAAKVSDQVAGINLRAPAGFGTTHFIEGFPHARVKPQEKSSSGATVVSTHKKTVLFSPDDNLQKALIDLIQNESKSIKIAIYTFTDKDIASALIDAHKRGVNVQMITDPSQLRERYNKCLTLQKAGIKVFEYNPNYITDTRSNLMHHKFVIFGSEQERDSCVWTGSFNFTQAACKRNQENAIIIQDAHTVKRFSDQFEKLKQRCHICK